jgi:excisionase family DNA binding protein
VRGFRNTHGITVYREGEWAERGEVTLPEAARMLNLSPLTVLRQIRAGVIPATQYCAGAPWVIKRRDIEDPQCSSALGRAAKARHHQIQIKRPLSFNNVVRWAS